MSTKKDNTEKTKPKTAPRLKINLNEEQKDIVTNYFANDVVLVHGDFASGKTLTAAHIALSAFFKRDINKIIVTKPLLKSRIQVLGALPGDFMEKMESHIGHIKQSMYDLTGDKVKIDKMINDGDIQFVDINLVKGHTFGSVDSTLLIVDEYQDMIYEDFRIILSRVGKTSKAVLVGSEQQIDKSIGANSAMYRVLKLEEAGSIPEGTSINRLKSNHRNEKTFKLIMELDKLK